MTIKEITDIKQIKNRKPQDLAVVCDEIRKILLKKLSEHGGHIAPNLGAVELTVAMHYVFNSPVDKFVFDVSHQCYTHKILTGRSLAFTDPAHYDDVNGFTNPKESDHDLFTIGHTSTALSLACGLAKARDLLKQNHKVLAVIGDGSLSGGEAYEALNNIAEQATQLIVVVNDNNMSIAENHGGYYAHLTDLRNSNGKAKNNMFTALGYKYFYVEEGNNIEELVKVFKKAQKLTTPVVVHVHTKKGCGYRFAEENPEKFHSGGPFNIQTGEYVNVGGGENYGEITYSYLAQKAAQDSSVVSISSGTPVIIGMTQPRRIAAQKQFVDVGICEEHAVAFASGIAKGGAKPVFAVFGSFVQRAFDQIHQDLALDNNPATLLIFWDSVYGMGGPTHNGLYDIAELSNIPNLVYLAPTNVEEYLSMLNWSIEQTQFSVAIRVPMFVHHGQAPNSDYSQLNKSQVVHEGKDVAIFAVGSMFQLAEDVCKVLSKYGINATLVNPVYLSGIDKQLIDSLTQNHSLVVTVEEGILEGGYGQKIASYLGDSGVAVKNFGLEKSFFGDYNPEHLLKDNNLTVDAVANYVLSKLNK